MKKLQCTLVLGILLIFSCTVVTGQDAFPYGFNYQAVARAASGNAITDTDLKVRISILSDTVSNNVVWQEEHVTGTNSYGLFTLVIGGSDAIRTGGTVDEFSMIDWGSSEMFIGIDIKNPVDANEYTAMGKAKLWSVPYALVAGQSREDLSSPFMFNGDTVYLMQNLALGSATPQKAKLAVVSSDDTSDDPLFEVRRKDGQPVFTVYNDGVEINVPFSGKKGSPSRGGFAIGGFDESKGTYVTDLFRVTPDSIRLYVNNNPAVDKGSPSRGGFAIGGFDQSKATLTELMRVTHDSTRIYTNEESEKGFAVGYLSAEQKATENFMKLNKTNSFIGHQSGRAVTTGINNTFMGFQSGLKNTTGSANIFIGQESGLSNIAGVRNIFIGYQAGLSNIGDASSSTIGHDNIYIGTRAGRDIDDGEHNTMVGSYSGFDGSATKSTFLGAFTGFGATGTANVFVGVDAGRYNTAGDNNTFLGTIAGNKNSGSTNTFIGYAAGYNSTTGTGNVFIGSYAGMNETGSNRLYISNSSDATPLIYGNFSTDMLALYGNTGINRSAYSTVSLAISPNSQYYGIYVDAGAVYYAAYFNGDVNSTGSFVKSDARLKKNIEKISSPLEKILALKGVSYEWNNELYPEKNLGEGTEIGLLAQDVEMIFPELVKEDPEGYKSVAYDKLSAVLIEAVREQQDTIEKMKTEAAQMQERLDKLEELVRALTGK